MTGTEYNADHSFSFQVSDETFTFHRLNLADRRPTGAQIAMAFGRHPSEDFYVLEHLATGELESLRPTETTDIAGPEKTFFVIKGDETYRFSVDGLAMEWPRPILTAEQILYLARAPKDREVVLHPDDGPPEMFEGDDAVHVGAPGAERLSIRPQHELTIFVDNEPFHTMRRHMTPNEIIVEAAKADPAQNYLVRIQGKERISYEGKGDEPIRLRNEMNFQVIFVGPTPVSDPNFEKGPALLIKGLLALGYEPRLTEGTMDHVSFEYTVQSGSKKGKVVRIGLVVPQDFPLAWPSGPHVSPAIHPYNPNHGPHPTWGIHASPFQGKESGQWQYWSRPYSHKDGITEPVAAYLTHIWKLWDSQ